MSTTSDTKLINLIRGWPAPAVLPAAQLKEASARVLSDVSVFVPALQYGPEPGYQPLREELATYLSDFFEVSRDPERICVTGGASQSVASILQSFTDPDYTKIIWAVAPCYHLMCPIFEDAGFRGRLRAVPEDAEGINLEWLEKGLKSYETTDPDRPVYKTLAPYRKAYRHIIYCVPTSSNPSGKSMTLARRRGLVRLARKYDALIIADDIYDMLRWPVLTAPSPTPPSTITPLQLTTPLPRLVDIDLSLGASPFDTPPPPSEHPASPSTTTTKLHFGHAISNGTFSKIIAPGVRTGWVEAAPAFAFGLGQTGCTLSGGAPSQLSAATVCAMMASGALDAHIHGTVRPALQRRHGLLMEAVRRCLGGFVEEEEEAVRAGGNGDVYGGYFVWLTLREGFDADEVARRAREDEKLIVAPGSMFRVKGDEEAVQFERSIRLCFSWEDEGNIVEGVERLGKVLRTWDEPRESRPSDLTSSLQVFK